MQEEKKEKKKSSILYRLTINAAFILLFAAMFYVGHMDGVQSLCNDLQGTMVEHTLTGEQFCLINKTYIEQYQYDTYLNNKINVDDINFTLAQ